MNSRNNSSLVCSLLLVIILVSGSTKLGGAAGDGYRGASVCNGTIGDCGAGDEVEMLLMHSPGRRLAGTSGRSISYDATDTGQSSFCKARSKSYSEACIALQKTRSHGLCKTVTCKRGSG
ncbi:hypothetical protein DCAR_0729250 [Daucus carota subsp. sativus]|uniref:Uncharacterized protein n=1 Tax=Daucus carota subsp. sativus TaxID=79200 RepID=A0A164U2V4_DAUCS|nr:hypothetical protein DCAR_0729250 [Daucus carota subsp. sativus]